jgi:two-component system sensor histidine kinase HydH
VLNSAHATHGQGTVRISLDSTPQGCELTVTDDGPGIPAEVRERLFTPFFTTKARGTGLGLSTAKRLIEAHGGTIAVECPTAGGTIVRLQFPVQVT